MSHILDDLKATVAALYQSADTLDAQESEAFELLELTLSDLDEGDRYALRDVLRALSLLGDGRFPALAALELELREAAGRLTGDESVSWDVEVARRVFSTHRFLDGQGPADFGDLTVSGNGDIRLGLGLRLSDDSLQRFLTALTKSAGHQSPVLALRPFFDTDADALANAIDSGHDAIAEYLRSQLILRHDPLAGRLVGVLPEIWHTRFNRLAGDLNARRLQIELATGPRMVEARKTAERLGLRSIRGLAFAFDVQPLVRRVQDAYSVDVAPDAPDTDRMMSLADRVLARVRSPIAQRWESRIKTLIEGSGELEGRHYQEKRLLGEDADIRSWRFDPEAALDDDADEPSAVPVQGRDYIVQKSDHLSRIAHRVYRGRADYRYLLAHNPHVRSPAELAEGQRIFIPHWPPPRSDRAFHLVSRTPLEVLAEGQSIRLPGRTLGPLDLSDEQRRDNIVRVLTETDVDKLVRARASRLAEGWVVLLDNQLVLEITDSDLDHTESRTIAQSAQPLDHEGLAKRLAAQLRGDIVLGGNHFLPFGFLAEDPHRKRWVTTALERAIADDLLDELLVQVAHDGAHAELKASTGERIARLETVDLEAIRLRPGLRLRDIQLAGADRTELLTLVWIAMLRGEPAGVWLPPVPGMRRFARHEDDQQLTLLAPMGTPVFPLSAGIIRHSGPTGAAGDAVLIEHGDGLFSRYSHLATVSVRPDQEVGPEQMLGRTGMSGDAPEPSLTVGIESRPDPNAFGWRVPDAVSRPVLELLGTLRTAPDGVRFERLEPGDGNGNEDEGRVSA